MIGMDDIRRRYNKGRKRGTAWSKKDFNDVIKLYYQKTKDAIIFDNYEYKIPYVGSILLVKVKPEIKVVDGKVVGLSIDYQATRKYGKKTYHENEHTDGFIFKIIWSKMNLTNITAYRFVPANHSFRRYLSRILKNKSKYGAVDAPLIIKAKKNV